MSRFRFSNRASALVTSTVTSSADIVQLETGAGAKMPVITGDDVFRATLIAPDGTHEIVTGVGVVGDVVNVLRGQEGTPAGTFPSGSRFEVRMTAGVANNFVQRSGDTMEGDLDLADHKILRATFDGPQVFSTIHVQLIRSHVIDPDTPFNGPAENSINIPPNSNSGIENRRPRYLGRPILNAQMMDGIVFQWFGDVNNVPPHLKLCNGANGTPDLRGKFIRGWSGTFAVGAEGGAETYNTSAAGAHFHGGATQPYTLTVADIPAHVHGMPQVSGTGGTEGSGTLGGASTRNTTSTGGGGAHQHGINAEAAHIHTTNAIPPFYALAYVMFNV